MFDSYMEVYLDHAAATPLAEDVLTEMYPYLTEHFYNPSAPYERARRVRRDVDAARSRVAHILGSRPANVTFTAGATEANNLALASVGGTVLTTEIEHESVRAYATAHGSVLVGVDAQGRVSPEEVGRLITDECELVSVSYANGEIGTIEPVRDISRVIRRVRQERLERGVMRPLLLHSDATQAAGYLSLNTSSLGCDLMTLSAAKIYGPKQVGVLWHADGVALRPIVVGGGQEAGLRSGTENVAGIIGFARALELAEGMRADEVRRLRKLTSHLRRQLVASLEGVVFQGPAKERGRLPGLVHLSIEGVDARRLVVALERRGVSVGTGSACAASKMRVSPVLLAIGLSQELTQGSLRLTLGRETRERDLDYAVSCLVECVRTERERLGASMR